MCLIIAFFEGKLKNYYNSLAALEGLDRRYPDFVSTLTSFLVLGLSI